VPPSQVTDEQLDAIEKRARAALRGAPPEISPAGSDGHYELAAGAAVLEYIREVGPADVLKLVGEIRRQREEYAHLLGRLHNVETWSIEK
jgi:hypothetical protein